MGGGECDTLVVAFPKFFFFWLESRSEEAGIMACAGDIGRVRDKCRGSPRKPEGCGIER